MRALGGLGLLLGLWQGAVLVFGIRPEIMPPPRAVWDAFALAPAAYVNGFLRTLAETLIGFAAGALVGVANGLIFLRAPLLRDLLFPIFVVSQTIPVIAFGALVVLWFGNTLLAKAAIAFYLTFFPVTVNTLLGLHAADPRQISLWRSFGASEARILLRLLLPGALPQIFVALRLGAALGLVGAIVGEWFGDTSGIGVLLLQAMFNENISALWAAILCAALLGMLLYGAVALAERRIVFWGAEQ